MRMTVEQYEQWIKQKSNKPAGFNRIERKYHNVPVELNGIKFHSTKEADRYLALSLLAKHGAITRLERQPKFMLQEAFFHNGVNYRAITYIGDFQYIDRGANVVEDVKAKSKKGKFYTTEVFNIKKKLFIKKYPHLELRMV